MPPICGAAVTSCIVLRCLRDLSPGKQRKGSTHRNDAQSSDLDQKKDHTLPECRPVAAGILYHKAGHAKGRSGGKQCLMERCDAPLLCSDREHQKQCAHQINYRKTCNNDLKKKKNGAACNEDIES